AFSNTADGQRGTPRRPSADGVTRLPSPLPYVFHLQGIAPKLLTHRVHGAGAAGTRVPPRQPCYNKEVHQLAAGRETSLARRSFRRFTVIVIVFVVSILFGGAAGMVAGFLRSSPSLDQVVFEQELTSYVYDVHGRRIASHYRENSIPVTLDQMPRHLLDAIVAIEDTRFYEHHGFDVRALLRAAWADVRRMLGHEGFLQGGSTITQQLAKNAFLSHERTLARKLQELLWAIQIERKYSKAEILETYLNEIYLGPGVYGVEAASRYYFDKSVSELTLPEAALIAGLAQ